jgi:hypothetical protein
VPEMAQWAPARYVLAAARAAANLAEQAQDAADAAAGITSGKGKHGKYAGEAGEAGGKVKHMKGEADGESVKHFKKGKMHGEA